MKRDVWHEGEKRLHRLVGVEEKLQTLGAAMIRHAMPDQHREFFTSQQSIVLSALDSGGQPWPFLRVGLPQFISSPDDTTLMINSTALVGEPPDLQLGQGGKLSVLGIELESRRRNRMNGTIAESSDNGITINVDQSFGNCPRYINKREPMELNNAHGEVVTDTQLSARDIDHIRTADIFFIASRAPETGEDRRAGVDVNHRGGKQGFVKVLEDQTVIFPDYDGNNFFNTFGNILLDARVGMLFPNFETGDVVTLAGHAELVMDDPSRAAEYGAARYVRVTPTQVIRAPGGLPLRYAMQEISPYAPEPGEF